MPAARLVRSLPPLALAALVGPLHAAPAPPTPTGRIAKIAVVGTQNIPLATVRAMITQKVGDAYDPKIAEKDRAAVQGLGSFRETAVAATSDPAGGVDLTYTAIGYFIVRAIKFTANTPTKEPTIPSATLLAQMTTKIGQVLDANALNRDLDTLFGSPTAYAQTQGNLYSVTPSALDIDPKTGVVTIPLVEYRVQTIKITGNTHVKTADILARMHTKPGDIYDANAILKDLETLYGTDRFLTLGPTTWTVAAPGQVVVTIPVAERRTDSTASLDESRGRVVPFLYDPVADPFPVVQVSVNGKPPLPFVVDTGTTFPLVISPWAAENIGLKSSPLTQKGDGYLFGTAPLESLVFQGTDRKNDVAFRFNQANAQADVVDLGFFTGLFSGPRIAGIIGWKALDPVTTRFDFAAKTLTVFDYSHPPLRVPGTTTLPIRLITNGFYGLPVTLAPGVTDALILDTGAYSTQIHRANIKALHPAAVSTAFSQRIEGLYVSPELRLPSLSLGALTVPDVAVDTMEDGTRASLGLDILAGYRLTLDGPNRELTLEPSARGGRYVQGWSGLEPASDDGGGWSVKTPRPGSPALRAGVRAGDKIIAVNGESVAGLPWERLTLLTRGVAGRPIRITLRRGSKMVTASWVPSDDFRAPRLPLDGLTMRKLNGQPWEVLDVSKNSPADRAGLRVGDKITHMAGASVLEMSTDQISDLMRRSSLPVTVTRAGRATPLAVTLVAPPAKP